MADQKRRSWFLAVALAVTVLCSGVAGAFQVVEAQLVLFVSAEGLDTNDGLESDSPLATIQEAIDRSTVHTTVWIAAGEYGPIRIEGASDLKLRASPGAQILGQDYESRAGVFIAGSVNVELDGLEVARSMRGVRVESSSHVVIRNVHVHDIGQEALSISNFSSFVELSDSLIHDTGKRIGSDGSRSYSSYGEGVYVGTGSGAVQDGTHDVMITRNDIFDTSSEAIDIKPYAYRVIVEANRVHDLATSTSGAIVVGIGAVDYRDAEVVIRGNYIWNISRTSEWNDGIGVHVSASALVEENVIWSTQHSGILVDADLVGINRIVEIRNNAVFHTGRAAIERWEPESNAAVTIEQNLVGFEATRLAEGTELLAGDSPSDAVVELQASLQHGDIREQITTSTLATSLPEVSKPTGSSTSIEPLGSFTETSLRNSPATGKTTPSSTSTTTAVPEKPPMQTPSSEASQPVREGDQMDKSDAVRRRPSRVRARTQLVTPLATTLDPFRISSPLFSVGRATGNLADISTRSGTMIVVERPERSKSARPRIVALLTLSTVVAVLAAGVNRFRREPFV